MTNTLRARCLAEGLGTFAIVFFGCGAIATLQGDPNARLMVNAVFGMVVAAAIYALGHVSAAHFNPAVTLGFAFVGRFPRREVPSYLAAQFGGAILASALHAYLIGIQARAALYGATVPTTDPLRTICLEAILTFFLMLVIVSVATDSRVHGAIPGLAIGMTVALCGLFGGPISGCSMNPARSLAPALFAGGPALTACPLYFLGPILGALVAARTYEAMREGVGK